LPFRAPVNGAELLDDLRDTFTRYVAFPDEHAAAAISLWTTATQRAIGFRIGAAVGAHEPGEAVR
jgi:hypothetical protein